MAGGNGSLYRNPGSPFMRIQVRSPTHWFSFSSGFALTYGGWDVKSGVPELSSWKGLSPNPLLGEMYGGVGPRGKA
jgi:hypothetical protein